MKGLQFRRDVVPAQAFLLDVLNHLLGLQVAHEALLAVVPTQARGLPTTPMVPDSNTTQSARNNSGTKDGRHVEQKVTVHSCPYQGSCAKHGWPQLFQTMPVWKARVIRTIRA